MKLQSDLNETESLIKSEEPNNKSDNSIKLEYDVLNIEEKNDIHIDMNNFPNR